MLTDVTQRQPVYRTKQPGKRRRTSYFRVLKMLLLFFSVSFCEAASERLEVAMLFPEVEGAYAKIFDKIMQGVKEHPQLSVSSFSVKKDTKAQEVNKWLENKMAKAILVLGQRSYRLAQKMDPDLPVVAGALVVPPSDYSTISLAGDPDQFFTHLKSLAPEVKRIFMVYNEKNSGWLVRIAKAAAKQHGLELLTFPAQGVREAVHHYRTILETARNQADAIWLPIDTVAPEKTILPMVLDAAWKRRLVVFSSNPLSVKRGALFALYPDHELMGHELADLAVEQIKNRSEPQAIPTRKLKVAVNQRTASHLGLRYSLSQQRGFDIIYPAPH